MASVSTDGKGNRSVQFVGADRRRRTVRLGKVPLKVAQEVKLRVERLLAAQLANVAVDSDTARWVAGLSDELAARLAAVGLVQGRAAAKLGAFLDDFIARRSDVKPATTANYRNSADRLLAHFGAAADLRGIGRGGADDWLVYLKGQGYAQATVARSVKHARQFFADAVRRGLAALNPFEGLKGGSQVNTARAFFVTREMTEKLLDAATDDEWRLVIALSRYAGLRCPSEHLALTWDDIDWERGRMLVRSSKKERDAAGGERWVPIFPEVLPHLERAFEEATEGAVHVVTRYREAKTSALRKRLAKTIRRAGLVAWPRLFQNLRASCETELVAAFPLHVVCEWIGNSAAVATAHYLQVTDRDFERAARSGAAALQNTVQQAAAPPRTQSQEEPQPVGASGSVRGGATPRDVGQDDRLVPVGGAP